MGLDNVLLLWLAFVGLGLILAMSPAKSLLKQTVRFYQRKSQTSISTSTLPPRKDLLEQCNAPSSIQSFVSSFVKRNLKSVTAQIIQYEENSSNDISNVEQAEPKTKTTARKKFSKKARNAKGSQTIVHEISEECSDHTTPQKKQRMPRPNYFIAVQVTDSQVLENAQRIQDGILRNSAVDLKHMTVSVKKSHMTLMAMHLADSTVIHSAIQCLDECLTALKEKMDSSPITLEFEGLNVFSGGSVLYISVRQSPALQTLVSMADIITSGMKQRGIVAAGQGFTPHMTLMKYRWKKHAHNSNAAKKVAKEAYAMFEREYLGSDTISSIQLCRMAGEREDGYYIVDHEIFLN